jgi:SAM-dependent methyltransferase
MAENTGKETLERIKPMRNYNRWIYERIAPFVGQRVLEVGCGIGNMFQFFADRERVVGIDIDPKQVAMIKKAFKGKENIRFAVEDIEKIDVKKYAREKFDTIICLNVLEHIRNDAKALRIFQRILAPGGTLVLQIPAHKFLYSTLDRGLSHFRRYTRKGLLSKTMRAGFTTAHCSYMNIFGIPGWFVNGRLLRRNILPAGQLKGFDRLLPILKRLDRAFNRVAGLSIIYAGRKQHGA